MERQQTMHRTRRAVGLCGIEVYGHVGYLPEERKLGRRFRVEVHVEYQVNELGREPLIDYREIATLVRERFSREGYLIEHIAEELAQAILDRWAPVEKVRLRVHKIHPPVGILAESAYAEVEMVRSAAE